MVAVGKKYEKASTDFYPKLAEVGGVIAELRFCRHEVDAQAAPGQFLRAVRTYHHACFF